MNTPPSPDQPRNAPPEASSRRPRRRLVRRLALYAAALLGLTFVVAYVGIGWVMVDKAVAAKRVALSGTPADVGLAYEDVSFHPRGDGTALTLRGWYIPAPRSADAAGTLVLVHGVDSNRVREPETYLPMVDGLHDQGFNLLLFDLRAHGESDGVLWSGGLFERMDVLGALDFVVEEKNASWDRLGVLSYSLGAASTLFAATEEPRLRVVVVDSSYADVNDLVVKEAADRTPLSPFMIGLLRPGMEALARLRYGLDLALLKPERSIASLPYPLLIIHSDADERFAVGFAHRLLQAAVDPETVLWTVPDSEHARIYVEHLDEYVQRVADYVNARFADLSTGDAARR